MKLDLKKISPQVSVLDNGIKVYSYADNSDLIRLEFIFDAGSRYCENPLVAQAAVSLLTKGTSSKSGEEVAEQFDYYGAYTDKLSDKDMGSFTVHGLARNFEPLVALCREIFTESVFSQHEIDIYLQKNYQKFLISKQKVGDVSRRELFKHVFGFEHPYGRSAIDTDFQNVLREQLIDFYGKHIASGLSAIVIAGAVGNNEIKLLNRYFGGNAVTTQVSSVIGSPLSSANKEHIVEMPSAVQTSLRLGMIAPVPVSVPAADVSTHYDLVTLNFIFGGYFGSRLSKNIREEKGYTYGISSYIISMRSAGLWQISSEIKKGAAKKVLKEIEKEKEKLCNDLISDKELTLVKNCFWGDMLRAMDGEFDKAEKKRFLINMSIDEQHYLKLWDTIQGTTAQALRDTAQKYFSQDNFVKVIIGE